MTGGLRKAVFFALVIGLTVVGYQYMIKPANTNLADAKTRVDMKLAKLAEYYEIPLDTLESVYIPLEWVCDNCGPAEEFYVWYMNDLWHIDD